MGGVALDVFEGLLHWWPIVSMVGGGILGWLFRAVRDYRRKDAEDHESLVDLTQQVTRMRADLDAIKAGNVAEYQESIATAHRRYHTDGEPLTIASRGRVNAMMHSLAALDDEDGTYQAMVDDINELPIYQPHSGN